MKVVKDNIWWIVPVAAVGFFATGSLTMTGGLSGISSDAGKHQAQQVQEDQSNVASAQQRRVTELNTYVEAAATAITDDQSASAPAASAVVANLQALQPSPAPTAVATVAPVAEVTRNAPADLLSVAPLPEAVAAQTAAAVVPQVSQPATADFFNNAQQNLAVANACGEDLKALADQARIYFPTGGLAGDETGFGIARLIGQVLRDCPGFSIQVEGHSDPSGDPNTNLRLSERRAESVVSRLAASGIDTTNFFAVGFGDRRPSNVRGPEKDAFYDRRVEFSVVEEAQQRVSFTTQAQPWRSNEPACMQQLETKAAQLRQYYSPGSITVPLADLDAAYALASDVVNCSGARLRLVGQHEDSAGSREDAKTGRLRALAMMSALTSAGFPTDQILVGAPSYSVGIPGQPGLPNSRLDFQVIAD